jgi:hypothetical protein
MSQNTQVALIALILFFAIAGVSALWSAWQKRRHDPNNPRPKQ